MAKVIADPDDLRQFALDLKNFSSDLESKVGHLNTRFRKLEDTWRDQEQAEFAQSFKQTMKVLGRFLKQSEEQVPFLMRKAEKLDDYLKQR